MGWNGMDAGAGHKDTPPPRLTCLLYLMQFNAIKLPLQKQFKIKRKKKVSKDELEPESLM